MQVVSVSSGIASTQVSHKLRGSLSAAILFATLLCAIGLSTPLCGQVTQLPLTAPPLITLPVDESQVTVLKGNTHPLARPQFDLGAAPATLPMERMLLVLKRSPAQESALEKLLDDQQNKHSASYHKWMTPEQFGQQFGPTDADMATITAWLQSHGFQVGSTKGRTVLEFSGSASQVQEAFHTTIHKYLVNGEQHWANSSDPSIPTALTPAVAGLASLNNFPRKPMNVRLGAFIRDQKTGKTKMISGSPLLTFPGNPENECTPANECYGLGPYDFATIYNVLPLWNSGIDGTGVTIAIVGETDIEMSDVQAFRSFFGLPANNPNFIWNGPDPGIQGDESEADIDVQWSGGVAKGATIDFVISESTETTFGVDLSAVYIVDQNLAPIMSESYGECELGIGTAGNQFYNALWQQASAQGITVFISAGDNGSAGCDDFDVQGPAPAQLGLQVSGFASTPYNVAVGGTDFNDFSNSTTYWSTSNNPTTQESALSYIPETTWNDSCSNAIWGTVSGFSTNPETNCNNSRLSGAVVPLGGSGGASACTAPSGSTPQSCAGGYPKPSWQTGTGVPADGKRDLPDVSLFASNGFVGEAYIICQSDSGGDCPYQFLEYGGTSVSSPSFAGIMAMIVQKYGPQGNANYIFYKLAQKSGASCTSAANEASDCIFNDVTMGTNAMPCSTGSPNCVTNSAGDSYGIMSGYSAEAGYDLATGLGSVNANNLVNQWDTIATLPSVTTLNSVTPTTITHGQSVNFSVTVAPQTGTGTPTGVISLMGPTTANSTTQGIGGFTLSNGTATGTTDLLPGGTYSLKASYPGDSTYEASESNGISVTVNKENSQPQIFLVTFGSNNQVLSGNTNTAPYGSPYILRVNVENSQGQLCAPAAATGETACPSGNVTMTNNGSTLDAGTYTLNSYGYFEDYVVQLPGGTDSVKAAYAGDNSFSASTVTTPITITPAPTTMNTPNVQYGSVGSQFTANVTVQAQSSGVAPTGTVTFMVNGSAVNGTTTYSGVAGSGSNPTASLTATFASANSAFPTAGSYTITAAYNGDANYGPTSASSTVQVLYPAPLLSMGPASGVTVAAGQTATVTALIDTGLKNVPVPSGTVPFIYWGPMTPVLGTETYTSTKDSNGNVALLASLTFTPSADVNIGASYAGDANYPAAGGGGLAYVTVTGSDFALIPMQSSISVSPGQQNNLSVFVYGQSNFTGTVNFSCSGIPTESTCSAGPTSAPGYTIVTVTTTAPSMRAATKWRNMPPWTVALAAPFALAVLLCFPRRQRARSLGGWFLAVMLVAATACGGGSGSGGGGGGGGGGNRGTPVGNYTITVTGTSGSLSHNITFTLVVQ